jgi:heptosyltransferase II
LKILIVKIGAIGDVVMCLPLVSHIRKKHPEAHITWLCGNQVAPMLRQFHDINEVLEVNERSLLTGSFPARLAAILSVWKNLGIRRFDRILYFYYSNLYRLLFLSASSKRMDRFERHPSKRQNPVPGRHHSWDYIQTFENSEGPFRFDLHYPEFRYRNPTFETLFSRQAIPKKRIALSCGGAKNLLRDDDLRRWPVNHYRELALLLTQNGYEIILTGAPSDLWVLDYFDGIECQSFIGKAGLNDFILLLKTADLLITHDSGPLHLADLANCPVLGLFGPTIPHEKVSLQTRSAWIWGGENLHCRPCYDGRNYSICSVNECLKQISAQTVFEKAKDILNG